MSLRARLTTFLLVLFLVVGATLLVGISRGARLYFEEVHYKLNKDVASHVAGSLRPFSAGEVDQPALKGLFMDVMHINPTLEVYLLDAEGRVLAYDAPPGRVRRESVGLSAVREAIEHPEHAATQRGDDPRSDTGKKPFSVAELHEDGELRGYLYVILGGEAHEQVAASLRESKMLRWGAVLVLVSVAVSGLAGVFGIGMLMRPLRRLREAMVRFREGERPEELALGGGGEVEELAATYQSMAERIASQFDELRQNDQRRREFVANISHDLRTPTGAIQGYLETLTLRWNRLGPPEREQFLRSALRQAERLGTLVDQLFELTRLEANEFEPVKEVLSLAELVQDVVAKFQPAAERKGVHLTASITYEVPPIVADIGLLERALDNLIDNALRYTPPEGFVRVHLSHSGGGVGVSVSDSGRGIPGDALPRVFDRFYRVERSTSDGPRGSGLGLAITKRIVDLHDGTIEVKSEPDTGTTFSFVLAAQE